METFSASPDFCPACGSIFPSLKQQGNVVCYNCNMEFKPDVFSDKEIEYTIHFNTFNPQKVFGKTKRESEDTADGPLVDRKCPKCGHEKMSYATLQLRSADEGQTVFFTCVKCKYKESENS